MAALFASSAGAPLAQTNPPAPPPPTSAPVLSPAPIGTSTPAPAPQATPVPITADPQAAAVPVGGSAIVHLAGIFGDATATAADPKLIDVAIDQGSRTLTIGGKAPGTTIVTIRDARGATHDIPVRVAYNAGTIGEGTVVHITGDPASADFLREVAAAAAARVAVPRPGATLVAPPDGFSVPNALQQDNIADILVPVLIQANDMFSVTGTTRVRIYNDAAPRISARSLMVSDFPERLTENGVLFTADLLRSAPSRFLYFHYNPVTEPARRIVLRAQNVSGAPALIQFISGDAGPGQNEMEVGHTSTQRFLVRLLQNQGSLVTIAPNSSLNLVQQDMPPMSVVSNILQLRVLNGASVHLTLYAQNASDAPDTPPASDGLLTSTVRHARGVYDIPDFKYERSWNVTDPYLELPIGQIPLPNKLQGEALSGDYGVAQSFVIKIQNPTRSPQPIAIYENPRGGRATGTFLIDGVLVQSHGVPAFSRYKIRQYTVPAKGYIRVSIHTMPEAGSSYPLRLEFAPDDGSVSPGGPGSPVY